MSRAARRSGLVIGGLVLGLLGSSVGLAQSALEPSNERTSSVAPGAVMPGPQPTIGGTALPYPAYGAPAPDVRQLKTTAGVPASVLLPDAIRIAVALSPTFALQNAQWAAIHARYTSSNQALYPAVSASAQLENEYSNGSSTSASSVSTSATSSPASATYRSATVSISQLVFDGGRTIANIRAAKNADSAGRATLLRELQALALSVATAYYTVLEDNATVAADAQLVREFELNEASVAAQIRGGAAARSDIAAAQFQTAQARGNLVTAQGSAIGAQASFATTLGLEAYVRVVPQQLTSEAVKTNPTYFGSLKRALALRPDYIAASYSVESAREALRYAKLARFPILAAGASDTTNGEFQRCASATQGSESSSQCSSASNSSTTKEISGSLTVPIYDQGTTNYNVAVAASELDQALATLNSTKLAVESDVRSSLATLISARSALVQARSELRAAQVSLDATQAQYKVGVATILNVVTAEANLTTAQAAAISALYGVQTAQQNYLYAVGVTDVEL